MNDHKVLVVDDERWIRLNLKRILEQAGMSVLMADSGHAAINILKDEKVDLIISDQRMPKMSGLELLSKIKKDHPSMVRVMLTGFADLQLALDAINQVEVHRLLLKPYSKDQITTTVQELLELSKAGAEISTVNLDQARLRKSTLDDLQKSHPGIDEVRRDRSGRIVIDDDFDDLENPMADFGSVEDILGEVSN
jgi:YesN/AraC family two-component response regulator